MQSLVICVTVNTDKHNSIKDSVNVRNLGAPVNETKVIINWSSDNNRSISHSQKLSAHTNNRRRKIHRSNAYKPWTSFVDTRRCRRWRQVVNVDWLSAWSASSRRPRLRRDDPWMFGRTRGKPRWRSWACEQSIHAVAQSLWTVNSRSSSVENPQHTACTGSLWDIAHKGSRKSVDKLIFPKNKGKHKKLCGWKMKQNKVCWKAGRIPNYSRAGTSGKQRVGKGVLRESRPGGHLDSRELSAAAGRADMVTLRCSNGWISAQELRS